MDFEYEINGQLKKISIEKKGDKAFATIGEKKMEVDSHVISDNCISMVIDGESYTIYLARAEGKKYIQVAGERYVVQETKGAKERKSFDAHVTGDETLICAPMPGRIVKILVKEGDKIKKKQSLVIVEAMKMENEIKSTFDGSVKKINFAENQMVGTEDTIIELTKD
jgi:biotin carboxyl carrier protein